MEGGSSCSPCGPLMGRETRREGDGSAGRKHHRSGSDWMHGSFNLSSTRVKSLMAELTLRTAGRGWCSCLRPTAIGDGMVPCDVGSDTARWCEMTAERLPEAWPYAASKSNAKHFPRK